MSTVALTRNDLSCHWYSSDGEPRHFVEKKDGSGLRPTTLADAKKNGWLPSVTTILKCLNRPALTNWMIEQSILAAMTTPRLPGEQDDAFVYRVLHVEKVQDQEGQKARDIGTEIHAAIEQALNGQPITDEMKVYVAPVLEACKKFGDVSVTEKIVIGKGYAGKTDAVFRDKGEYTVVDFKTTSRLPTKGSYPEARLQLSAYAVADHWASCCKTCNIYISTKEPGQIIDFVHDDWEDTYENGFQPLVKVWSWLNSYWP